MASTEDGPAATGSTAKAAVTIVGDLMKIAGDNPDTRQAGRELGKAALTVAKTINVCLLPLAAINFGAEKARAYFNGPFREQLSEKARAIPEDNVVEPKASIAGPALQALAFSHEEPSLREMYLNLLRTAMDSRVTGKAHPAFVEVIKQLQAEEARLLRTVLSSPGVALLELRYSQKDTTGYEVYATHVPPFENTLTKQAVPAPDFPAMADNWVRLGLVDVSYETWFNSEDRYAFSEGRPEVKAFRLKYPEDQWDLAVQRGHMRRTAFGEMFARAVGLLDGQPIEAQ